MLKLFSKLFGQRYSEEESSYRDKTWKAIDDLVPDESKKNIESWANFKKQALKEIDEKIHYARSIGKSPYLLEQERVASINNMLKKEHELLINGYSLTEEDYFSDLYPNLCRFSFFSGQEATFSGETVAQVTYSLSSFDYQISSSARDKLIGKCDVDAITNISRIFRKNYEKLRGAELAGHKTIMLSENRKACDLCNSLERESSIHAFLKAYKNSSIAFPHEIPWEDEVQYCEGPHLIAVPKGGCNA